MAVQVANDHERDVGAIRMDDLRNPREAAELLLGGAQQPQHVERVDAVVRRRPRQGSPETHRQVRGLGRVSLPPTVGSHIGGKKETPR